MNNQQTLSRGPLYGTVPAQFAQLNVGGDMFGDEFDWGEPEIQCDAESLAGEGLDFPRGVGAECQF